MAEPRFGSRVNDGIVPKPAGQSANGKTRRALCRDLTLPQLRGGKQVSRKEI